MKKVEKILKEHMIRADPSIAGRWEETMGYDTTKAILEAMKESAWEAWITQEQSHWDYVTATMGFDTFQQECPGVLHEQFERWWNEDAKIFN